MTSNVPHPEQEPQWQQPSFQPAPEPAPAPVAPPFTSGSLILPAARVQPPSAVETTVRTLSGLVWPVMILLSFMGVVPFWPAILAAIVTSTVLGNVGKHLKARRKVAALPRRITPGGQDTLR